MPRRRARVKAQAAGAASRCRRLCSSEAMTPMSRIAPITASEIVGLTLPMNSLRPSLRPTKTSSAARAALRY